MYRCKHTFTATWTILFMTALSMISAAILALLASTLKGKKEAARELDRSQQLLMSAKIFSPDGYFLLSKDGTFIPAKNAAHGKLVAASKDEKATAKDIEEVYRYRVQPRLVDRAGKVLTYEDVGLDMKKYLQQWKTAKPGTLSYLPLYEILDNSGQGRIEEYVIPITGFGLWDRIIGYISILPDGETVRGIAWYDQKETPGLGATIAEPSWQKQFLGKKIFRLTEKGEIDKARSPIGIVVVKGTVREVFGDSPRGKNAVDGMAGATLTGNGVTKAYKDNLGQYRSFFETLHNNHEDEVRDGA